MSPRFLLRYVIISVLSSVAVLLYWFLYRKPVVGIDDANIYFQYVKNFVSGFGFVYFRGTEPVEGFSSFLWVLLISPFGFSNCLESCILFLNIALFTFTLYISVTFIHRLNKQNNFLSIPTALFLAMIILVPGYIEWVVLTLMETGLWSLLIVSITVLLCRERIGKGEIYSISLLLFLLVLTRPESMVYAPVFVLLLGIRLYSEAHQISSVIKKMIVPASAVFSSFIFLIAFRLLYFGYPLPNTYYAKVSTNKLYNLKHGFQYFVGSVLNSPLLMVVVIALVLSMLYLIKILRKEWRDKRRFQLEYSLMVQALLVCITIVSFALPIYVGGDHFKMFRLFQPFVPVYLFLLFNVPFWLHLFKIEWTSESFQLRKSLLLLLLIPLIYTLTRTPLHSILKQKSPLQWEFTLAELGREEGEKLNRLFSHLKKLPSVGVSAAGGISYTYEGEIIDLMGLNNEQMAHASGDRLGTKNHAAFHKRTFYELAPDIFHGYFKLTQFVNSPADTAVIENQPGFSKSFASNMYKDIFEDIEFRKSYQRVIIAKPEERLFLKTFCKTSYIDTLKNSGLMVFPLSRNNLLYVNRQPQ